MFKHWTFHSVAFLAVFQNLNWYVIDEHGRGYGSWMTVESFRKRQRDGDPIIENPWNVVLQVRSD